MPRFGAFSAIDRLGSGGMGEVWRGEHELTGTAVAIKLVLGEGPTGQLDRAAFEREVESVARLDHPGIVTVFDYGLTGGKPYLVMELLDGGSLQAQPPTTWPEIKDALLRLLEALAYAHARGVLHRDLKLSNVMFGGGASLRSGLRLIDFGIAAAIQGTNDQGLAGAGTPAYMAPEQVRGDFAAEGPWTDLYAVGCLAYRLAAGRPVFGGPADAVLRMQLLEAPPPLDAVLPVPAGLDAWVARLLQKRPRDRYAFAAEAQRALEALGDSCLPPARDRIARASEAPTRGGAPDRDGEPTIATPPLFETATTTPASPTTASATILGAGLGLWGLRPIPMVDRETEREAAWSALAGVVADGRARALVLHGPSGTGKSRIAEWLVERAHETATAHVVHAVHEEIPSPAHGLAAAIARRLGCSGVPRDEAVARIETTLAELGPLDGDEVRGLADVVTPIRADDVTLRGGRGASSDRMRTFERFLGRVAHDRPVVLWLDDVQWSHDALELTAHLMRAREERPVPVLLVLTVRDEALAEVPFMAAQLEAIAALPGARALTVGPLPEPAHHELVQRLLGLSGEVARRVQERTAGNPLFAVHLVGSWVRAGDLVPGRDGFELLDTAELRLPDDLHRFWVARIDEALAGRTANDRLAVELAAALGQEVSLAELDEICARRGTRLGSEVVDDLVRRRLLRRTRDGIAFAHSMIREAIERASFEAGRGAAHHRDCAEVVAASGAPDADARVGRHLLAAGADEDALGPLLHAAIALWRRGELRSALALLDARDEAIERLALPAGDPRRGEGLLIRARSHKLLGDFERVSESAGRLAVGARAHGWHALLPYALHLLATVEQQAGRFDAAEKLTREALLRLATGTDEYARMETLWQHGWTCIVKGRLDEAEAAFGETVAIADAAGDRRARATGQRGLANVSGRRGDYARAIEHARRAVAGFEEGGDRMGLAMAENVVGENLRYAGDLDAAEAAFERARALGAMLGSNERAVPTLNLGFLMFDRARFDEARARFEEAVAILERTTRRAVLLEAEAGRCAVAAVNGTEAEWSAARDRLEAILAEVPVKNRDLADVLDAAAAACEQASATERATWCRRTAAARRPA